MIGKRVNDDEDKSYTNHSTEKSAKNKDASVNDTGDEVISVSGDYDPHTTVYESRKIGEPPRSRCCTIGFRHKEAENNESIAPIIHHDKPEEGTMPEHRHVRTTCKGMQQ